jgi:mono/diheme cytochrome c family protein
MPKNIQERLLTCAVLILTAICVPTLAGQSAPAPSTPAYLAQADRHWGMLKTYCIVCHNAKLRTGGLALDQLVNSNVPEHAETWEKVIRKLRGGLMPPPGMRRPDRQQSDAFVAWMEGYLDAAAGPHPNPGEVALHRLNRKEYANAVYDILGLKVDGAELLPQDAQSDGFDNIANVLQTSPIFFNQYVAAARTVAVEAVGNPDPRPGSETYLNPNKGGQAFHVDGLPLGTRGGFAVQHLFAADGEYEINLPSLFRNIWFVGIEHQTTLIITLDGAKVFSASIGGPEDERGLDINQSPTQDKINARFKNIRFKAKAGPHQVAVTFLAQTLSESDDSLMHLGDATGFDRMTRVNSFEIRGPFNPTGLSNTPSRQRIFTCYPKSPSQEQACATQILSTIARRAYRRPVKSGDMAELLEFYEKGRQHGGFDEGIRSGLTRILASPYFLYRATIPDPNNKVRDSIYRLRDLELASRLSFFLWSSLPDDQLLKVAEEGRLKDKPMLERQVRRLLADPHASTLATNFAYQWLQLGDLDQIVPDPKVFPSADVRDDMVKEVELFVDSVFREDRSVLDLMTADYTFLNQRLATHYGVRSVKGDRFQRVHLTDSARRGLLGKGAVLMVSSYPDRTSPVRRGAWILDNIIGTPPASPPPNVSALLKDNKVGAKVFKSVRERLAEHRSQSSCNACHGILDPIGFSLENFDAVGRWRNVELFAGTPIDATGTLPDGTKLAGPDDLRAALLRNPEQFVQTLTEKLMTYALGRDLEYYDMPTVRKIVHSSAADNYRFSSLVLGIVESDAFRLKKVDQNDAPPGLVETARK